jgi:starch-binding outer membrane protein, SusD/RagB family
MKTFNTKLYMLALVMVFAGACNNELELSDPDAIGSDISLATNDNVKSVLLGAYNALSNGDLFGGTTQRNSELLGANGEIKWSGTFTDPGDIFNKDMATTSGDAADTWIAAYNAINITNNVLSALDVVDADNRSQVEGEALFIRGLVYFELVQLFGKPYVAGSANSELGVPILLVEDRNSIEQFPRNTVEEVYQQVLDDLIASESLLEEGPNPGLASAEAAAAILSRVYLQMEDYPNARDAANRVITSGNYSLMSAFADCFNGGTTDEDIFDIAVSSVDGVNSMFTFFASTDAGGRGDIEIEDAHLNLYEAVDDRLALFYEDPVTSETRSGKWAYQYANVKVVRLAEMYLTRAEANFRLSTTVGDTPLNDVNTIRNRSSLTDLGTTTLNDILNERHLELAHEGQRIHDTKRLKKSVTEGATIFNYDNDKLVFPIPQREINVNSNLVQNNGYGN